MKFKHTLHVFVDNFSITYKLLLYRLIVITISICLSIAVIYPTLGKITGSDQFATLREAFSHLGTGLGNLNLDEIQTALNKIKSAFGGFTELVGDKKGLVIACAVLLLVVHLVKKFFYGLGNYVAGALIGDKMSLQANSSFIGSLVKNLGKASLYNLIYIPLSFLYNAAVFTLLWAIFFKGVLFIPLLLRIFLLVTCFIGLTTVKMTFTTDWLPALIYGKKNNRQAIAYSFSRKGKKSWNIFSNFLVLVFIIFAANVAAIVFTFGAGIILTIPASYILLISFEFVNYCDGNSLRYFTDKDTIVGTEKEKAVSIDEFFKGEQ